MNIVQDLYVDRFKALIFQAYLIEEKQLNAIDCGRIHFYSECLHVYQCGTAFVGGKFVLNNGEIVCRESIEVADNFFKNQKSKSRFSFQFFKNKEKGWDFSFSDLELECISRAYKHLKNKKEKVILKCEKSSIEAGKFDWNFLFSKDCLAKKLLNLKDD